MTFTTNTPGRADTVDLPETQRFPHNTAAARVDEVRLAPAAQHF